MVAVLVFVGGMAFGTLSQALGVILGKPDRHRPRVALLQALLPYVYIPIMGAGFGLLVLLGSALDAVVHQLTNWPQLMAVLGWLGGPMVYIFGTVVLFLFTVSVYLVLPARRPSLTDALLGAMVAAVLWELTRYALVWYFENLTMVGVIYGSLGTVIVVLLSFEAAAMILLLGAQVVATLEAHRDGEGATQR